MKKSWVLFSLFNFFVAALMGLILRGAFVWGLEWVEYRNMMHGHSHVAMLGWGYLALYSLIWYRFIPKGKRENSIYSLLFWFTQFTVLGMMISFPIQGYGAVSITFSSLHILASYVFSYRVWKDHQTRNPEIRLLLKTAFILMIISTMGVWILGPLAMSGGRNSTFYQVAIQFYLHFQFHGWFTFAVLALLMDAVTKGLSLNKKLFQWFYFLLLPSIVFTYGLVVFWGYRGDITLIINGFGLVFQLLAMILFLKLIGDGINRDLLDTFPLLRTLYGFGLASWILKILLQTAVVVPNIAMISFTLRSFMIGFIHLTMLGFVSGLLYALFLGSGALMKNSLMVSGMVAFLLGFVLTELLLFVQGLYYWLQWGQLSYYYEAIFGASFLLPLSIFIILISQITKIGSKSEKYYLLS